MCVDKQDKIRQRRAPWNKCQATLVCFDRRTFAATQPCKVSKAMKTRLISNNSQFARFRINEEPSRGSSCFSTVINVELEIRTIRDVKAAWFVYPYTEAKRNAIARAAGSAYSDAAPMTKRERAGVRASDNGHNCDRFQSPITIVPRVHSTHERRTKC